MLVRAAGACVMQGKDRVAIVRRHSIEELPEGVCRKMPAIQQDQRNRVCVLRSKGLQQEAMAAQQC